ncbi:pirin family protein [Thalassobacillus hwangdonensis]|uniref:Pirin family protein n=1 Tax=Thalassobacillus hwangdonensis TaxID=546108 RepID=A0ABW3L798_9BACI
MSVAEFKRNVDKQWYVKYDEVGFPSIQKGWVLPAGQFEMFDPFILMAEDWFKKGTFTDHPHRGFQTITYVVDGRLEHIDNGGGRDILEPGDVQYMNAGGGARHAEDGVEDDIAHTLQLWLNLPKEKKFTGTRYQNLYGEDAPVVRFDGGQAKVFSGNVAGVKGPMDSIVPITLTELTMEEGASFTLDLPENHNAFAYVLAGSADIGEDPVNLNKHGVATLSFNEEAPNDATSELKVTSKKRRTRVLVYSGKPIREQVVAHGPFVMNSMEEIKQAYEDFRNGKFGPPAV